MIKIFDDKHSPDRIPSNSATKQTQTITYRKFCPTCKTQHTYKTHTHTLPQSIHTHTQGIHSHSHSRTHMHTLTHRAQCSDVSIDASLSALTARRVTALGAHWVRTGRGHALHGVYRSVEMCVTEECTVLMEICQSFGYLWFGLSRAR